MISMRWVVGLWWPLALSSSAGAVWHAARFDPTSLAPCVGVRGVEYDPALLTFIARDGRWSREEDGGGGLCGKRNGKSQTSSTVVYSFNE